MKFLDKKYFPQYTFFLIVIFSVLYNLSYDIKVLYFISSFILIILLGIFLKIFIKKISDEANIQAFMDEKKNYLKLGLCFIFLSLYPVLHFYIKNYVSLDVHYLLTGVFAVLTGILASALICLLLFRNILISFYLSSAAGVMFYFINYKTTGSMGIFLVTALILCGVYFLYKKGAKKPFKNAIFIITIILGIFTCIDFIPIALKLPGGVYNNFKNSNNFISKDKFKNEKLINLENKRDIYILMLDMYPGVKALERFSGFDNSNFADELRKRGFYVFDDIYSNYSRTAVSIPSMLNMSYREDIEYKNRKDAIDNAKIFKLAKTSGRKIVYLNQAPFFRLIQPAGAKVIRTLDAKIYEKELIKTYNESLIYTKCHSFILDKIEIGKNVEAKPFSALKNDIVSDNSNKFVFAHILMPHPPYLYDENGNKIDDTENDDKFQNSKLIVNKKSFISYLKYTNKEVLDFIDYAFEHSKQPPVILITGDHGIRSNEYENWRQHIDKSLADKLAMHLTFATFAAYYNPDDDKKEIKEAKSIVNLFRLFSNEIFDTKYDVIPDKHTIFFCISECAADSLEHYNKFKTYDREELEEFF